MFKKNTAMLQTPFPLPGDVFITEELRRRPLPAADYLAEKHALQKLAASMVDGPDAVLPQFVVLAMEMIGGVSAGLSLYEPRPEPGIFRWHHVVGKLAAFEGATTPRNYSPCGVTLDARAPVLTRHSESLYKWISDAEIVVPEVLLVPLYIGGTEPLGTLWIVSDEDGHFHSDHARIASELATFVGIALRMQRGDQQLRLALEQQETLAREMNHRVKNVFAVADSMVRFSARGDRSKDEMVALLSGRLQALARAHALVMRDLDPSSPRMSTLGDLVAAIVQPHEDNEGRFAISGPSVSCGEKAINGLSLVLHELTTNAAKYGALADHGGSISIDWSEVGDNIVLTWTEAGGPSISEPPQKGGFGSKLVESTILRQFYGTAEYDWLPSGLTVKMVIPKESLLS